MTEEDKKVLEDWIHTNFPVGFLSKISGEQWYIAFLFHRERKHTEEMQYLRRRVEALEETNLHFRDYLFQVEKKLEYEEKCRRSAMESLSAIIDLNLTR
jgi:hypothetical protein